MTKAERKSLMAEYREARGKLAALRKRVEGIGKTFFKDECARLFAENETLVDFGWRQFTPAFNDGEPCRFRCYKDDPFVNGRDPEYDEEPDDPAAYPALTDAGWERLRETVAAFLADFDPGELEDWFGDCVRVKVTREGIETESYNPY